MIEPDLKHWEITTANLLTYSLMNFWQQSWKQTTTHHQNWKSKSEVTESLFMTVSTDLQFWNNVESPSLSRTAGQSKQKIQCSSQFWQYVKIGMGMKK